MTKIIKFRHLYVLLFFLMKRLDAQFNQNMYDMNRNVYSYRHNPGMELEKETNYKWWFIGPATNIGINTHLTGFSVYDLFNRNESAFQTIKKYAGTRSSNDFLGANANIPILEVGWRWKNDEKKERWYFSLGIDVNAYGYGFFPQKLSEFLVNGYGYESFVDLSELKAQAGVYTSYYFGINYKKDDSPFTFGGKMKIYNSVFSINTDNKSYIQTLPNYKSNVDIIFNNELYIRRAGITNDIKASDFFFSGNMGAGIDLGLTYQKDNIKFTASILDLGFIYNKTNTIIERYKIHKEYSGENLSSGTSKSMDEFIKELEQDGKKKDTVKGGFFTYVPTVIHLGLTYTFFGKEVMERIPGSNCKNCDHLTEAFTPKQNVGILFTSIFRGFRPYNGVTFFYHSQQLKYFEYKVTYTLEKYNFYNIGLVLAYRGFYISAENLIGYSDLLKSNGQSFSLGYTFMFN